MSIHLFARPLVQLVLVLLAGACLPVLHAYPSASRAARGSEDVAPILSAARRAIGWGSWPTGLCLRLSGTLTYLGVDERGVTEFTSDGRLRQAFEGELEREVRFDGEVLRLAEHARLWREPQLFAREVELLRGWLHGGYWLDPGAPLEIALAVPADAAAGPTVLLVRLAGGLLEARVELDSEHRVRLLSVPSGDGFLRTEFEEYSEVAREAAWADGAFVGSGVRIAHRVSGELSFGSRFSLVAQTAAFEPLVQERFGPAPDRVDASFDADVPAEIVVHRARSGHLFVSALVNGEDVGLFLFDTGAGFSGLRVSVAEELGLAPFGETRLTGMGGGVTRAGLRRARTLQLGPLTVTDLLLIDTPPGMHSEVDGIPVVGVLGWDILLRSVVELEAAGGLRLYDPAQYRLAAGEWLPLTLHYKVPYVSARFEAEDEVEGLFMLDCGAAGITALFFHDAAQTLGLLARAGGGSEPGEPDSTGRGAGGMFQHRREELAWFDFAGRRQEPLSVLVSTAPDGEADPYSLGLIGGELLSPFRVVLDYAGRRVAILPR